MSQVFGNSATYFTRADENRINELQKLLNRSNNSDNDDDEDDNHQQQKQKQLHDPLAQSVYEQELAELTVKKEKFIEEGLENMRRAAKQNPISMRQHNNNSYFGSSSSSSNNIHGKSNNNTYFDGSASFLFSRIIGGLVSSIFPSSSSSSNSTNVLLSPQTNKPLSPALNQHHHRSSSEGTASFLLDRKKSDIDFVAAANNTTSATPSKGLHTKGNEGSSVSSISSTSLPISIRLAWSIYGVCALALFMQSLLHVQDPSKISNNMNAATDDPNSNASSKGKFEHMAFFREVFHRESTLSMLLRVSEGFLGLVGSCALMLHLNNTAASSSQAQYQQQQQQGRPLNNSNDNSSSKQKQQQQILINNNEGLTKRGNVATTSPTLSTRHSRAPSADFGGTSMMMNGANSTGGPSGTGNSNPTSSSSTSNIVNMPSSSTTNSSNEDSMSANANVPISPAVGLLLRISELFAVFFAVFALMYSAVLLAPLEHLSEQNLLKSRIKNEQIVMKHVGVTMVLLWMITNFVFALVAKRIQS